MKSFADRGDTLAVLRRLEDLRPDSQRRWGQMTATQMLCQLSDSFKCVMGEKAVEPKITLQRTVVKWAVLYLPVKWPQGIATMPENDQAVGGSQPITFEADRQELTSLIERFSEKGFSRSSHPLMGPCEKGWQRWGYLHADHHWRQFGL